MTTRKILGKRSTSPLGLGFAPCWRRRRPIAESLSTRKRRPVASPLRSARLRPHRDPGPHPHLRWKMNTCTRLRTCRTMPQLRPRPCRPHLHRLSCITRLCVTIPPGEKFCPGRGWYVSELALSRACLLAPTRMLTHSPAPLFVRPTEDSGRAQVCMFQTLVPAVRSAGERLAATGGCTFRHVPRTLSHSRSHALTLAPPSLVLQVHQAPRLSRVRPAQSGKRLLHAQRGDRIIRPDPTGARVPEWHSILLKCQHCSSHGYDTYRQVIKKKEEKQTHRLPRPRPRPRPPRPPPPGATRAGLFFA